VEEEIAFGLESQLGDKTEAVRKANEILEAFGRSHWAALGTHMLSQGQRHLVCLMAVLAMQPSVILLDEPYAGLDWPTSSALYQWLEGLDQQIVLITHDLEHLRDFDRIIWLDDGKLAMDGAPETVLAAYIKEMKLRSHSDLAPAHEKATTISQVGA
jgi:biotin transport system ATP-binding protein